MLVLNRGREETIVVPIGEGKTITIMVVDIRGDSVRIGIDAPKEIKVWRSEVFDRIEAERENVI